MIADEYKKTIDGSEIKKIFFEVLPAIYKDKIVKAFDFDQYHYILFVDKSTLLISITDHASVVLDKIDAEKEFFKSQGLDEKVEKEKLASLIINAIVDRMKKHASSSSTVAQELTTELNKEKFTLKKLTAKLENHSEYLRHEMSEHIYKVFFKDKSHLILIKTSDKLYMEVGYDG